MHTTVVFEVRWFVAAGNFSERAMRKEFPTGAKAKEFKHEQSAKHPDRRYTVVKITTEEVA